MPGLSHPLYQGGVMSLQSADGDVDEAVNEPEGVANRLRQLDDQLLGNELLPSNRHGNHAVVIADYNRFDSGVEAENMPDVVDVRRIGDGEVLRRETQLLLVCAAAPLNRNGQLALDRCRIEMRPFQDGRRTFRFGHTTP